MSRLAINLPSAIPGVSASDVMRAAPACQCQRFRALNGYLPNTLGADVYGPPDPAAATDSGWSWDSFWKNIDRGVTTATNAVNTYRAATEARAATGAPAAAPAAPAPAPAAPAAASDKSRTVLMIGGAAVVGVLALVLIARK